MAEYFEFLDIKSRIMKSFETLPLDVDFGPTSPTVPGEAEAEAMATKTGKKIGQWRTSGESNVMSGIPSSSQPRRIPPVAIY